MSIYASYSLFFPLTSSVTSSPEPWIKHGDLIIWIALVVLVMGLIKWLGAGSLTALTKLIAALPKEFLWFSKTVHPAAKINGMVLLLGFGYLFLVTCIKTFEKSWNAIDSVRKHEKIDISIPPILTFYFLVLMTLGLLCSWLCLSCRDKDG